MWFYFNFIKPTSFSKANFILKKELIAWQSWCQKLLPIGFHMVPKFLLFDFINQQICFSTFGDYVQNFYKWISNFDAPDANKNCQKFQRFTVIHSEENSTCSSAGKWSQWFLDEPLFDQILRLTAFHSKSSLLHPTSKTMTESDFTWITFNFRSCLAIALRCSSVSLCTPPHDFWAVQTKILPHYFFLLFAENLFWNWSQKRKVQFPTLVSAKCSSFYRVVLNPLHLQTFLVQFWD